jgi:hypothetical protein
MESKVISLNGLVVQGEGNVASVMNGETVMLSVHNGKYYNLGKTGGAIWNLIRVESSVNDVIDALTAEYEVDRTACESEVIAFIEQLIEQGLVKYDQRLA